MTAPIPRSDAILDRLLRLHPKLIDLTLDRLERLLGLLGHPERRLNNVIHVAGTNGKGSTTAMIRAGLEAAGASVNVYTSPHLARFHERIRLSGALISEQTLSALLEECEDVNGPEPITFFEITTAAALLAFGRHPADYTLLEVGLGGRLDATNVVEHPALTVITPVSVDHQQYLGETLAEIAGEKAGILKRGIPCIVGPQPEAALEVIEEAAARVGAPLLVHGRDWSVWREHGRLAFQDESGLLDLEPPRLPGAHQIENAGAALAALRALGRDQGAAEALTGAHWPARMQRLRTGPLIDLVPAGAEIWLDGGHNAAAGRAIAAHLAELEERSPRPLYLVCGMLNTKNPGAFLEPFAGLTRRIHTLAIPFEANSLSADDLAAAARRAGLDARAEPDLDAAFYALGASAEEGARILICGSLYLAGRILQTHE